MPDTQTTGSSSTGLNQALNSSYQYQDGDSEDDFIRRNMFSKGTGYGFTNFANPVGGFIGAFRGRHAFERMRSRYEAQVDEADRQNRANELQGKALDLYGMQAGEDNQRAGAIGNLDAAYHDGTRQATRENEYQAGLFNATAGLAQQSVEGNRQNALAQARAGRMGGSQDIEAQGRLAAALQSGVYDASSQGMRRMYDQNTADTNQFYDQRRAILSGDPQKAAQYNAMAQGIGNQIERSNRMDDYLGARAQLRRGTADNNSQLIGGLGYAGAGALDQAYAYRGY